MRVAILTLGCDRNTVDSEYMAGLLAARGHRVFSAEESEEYDVIIVNTCGFIDSAKAESVNAIVRWAEEKTRRRKATGRSFRLYVVGCLAQRYAAELLESIPELDGIAGVGKWRQIVRMIEGGARPSRHSIITSLPMRKPDVKITRPMPRQKLGPFPYAFLKISDGCSHRCSFCAIPFIKGRYGSVPRKILLKEAQDLIRRGVKEVVLVAQDLLRYGQDLYKNYHLAELVRDIVQIPGKFWVRLLYLYPGRIPGRLVRLFYEEHKLCPYIDIPLQHLSPAVLRRMRRPVNIDATLRMLERLREKIPNLTIRTTFIVGFPGESRADFNLLISGVKRFGFERMGAFLYSREEGTVAERFNGAVSKRTAHRRLDRLMRAQAEISLRHNQSQIGKTTEVLIDEVFPEVNIYIGRTQADAPEVDGIVYVKSQRPLKVGTFIKVRITNAQTYDLLGEAFGETKKHRCH